MAGTRSHRSTWTCRTRRALQRRRRPRRRPPSNNIQQQPDWSSCSACAGGATVPYSMTEGVANPSLSGSAAQFWLGGSTPYSSAIWWKELAPVDAANFKYDLDFYV